MASRIFTLGPRLSTSLSLTRCLYSPLSPSTRTIPSLYTPTRGMIIVLDPHEVRLNNLRDNAGAVKRSVRIGRGVGTGTGKTSKRGHKGQLARTGKGKPRPGFMGGSATLHKTMRKYGFKNTRFERNLQGVNVDVLQHHINNKTINPFKKITIKELYDATALGKQIKHGVKLLARGTENLTTRNLHIEVNDCSAAARDAIEKLGGKVDLVYHNPLSLRYTVKPEKFLFKPTFARPPPRLHERKYPNFPEPTPFTASPTVLENIEYSADFNANRKKEQKERKEKLDNAIKKEKRSPHKERKEQAIARRAAAAEVANTAETTEVKKEKGSKKGSKQ